MDRPFAELIVDFINGVDKLFGGLVVGKKRGGCLILTNQVADTDCD